MSKMQIAIRAEDPNGVVAVINIEVKTKKWLPLRSADKNKMKDFRPIRDVHLTMGGSEKGGWTYDSRWGTMVVKR